MSPSEHPLAGVLAWVARVISGVQIRWEGAPPEARQRVYFANHSSHLDFVVLWSALPVEIRSRTRPVAARDYWEKGLLRPYLASKVFRAALIERGDRTAAPGEGMAAGRTLIDRLLAALGEEGSLIVFPEGTRGTGEEVGAFKSGIYHLARRKPDLEFVPAYLENLNRVLPKGEVLPVPLLSTVTFGPPLRLLAEETRQSFLERARAAVCALRRR
jgi:1-acyl-sn-glycerol-3-phosphate acyltransferase